MPTEHDFSSLTFRFVTADQVDEPVALDAREVHALLKRAVANLDELFTVFGPGSVFTDTPEDPENADSADSAAKDSAGMSLQVSWDPDPSVVSAELQTTVITLVASGLIMMARDVIKDHPANLANPDPS